MKIKNALPFYIFLQVIYLLYKVYYQPNKLTIYQYGALLIYFSKSSQILILSCVVFMWDPGEKPESFVQYVLHSFLRVENLCFWQSVLNGTYPHAIQQTVEQTKVHISVHCVLVYNYYLKSKNALIEVGVWALANLSSGKRPM